MYQTFDSTSLTDMGTSPSPKALQAVKRPLLSLLYSERGEERGGGVVSSFPRSLNWLTADPHTLQPVPSPNSCPFPTTDCCFVL